jgi:hypothetical protein
MLLRSCLIVVTVFATGDLAWSADPPQRVGDGAEMRHEGGAKLAQIGRLIRAADDLDAAGAAELARQARQRAGALIDEESTRLAHEQSKLDGLSHALNQCQIAVTVVIAESAHLRRDDVARALRSIGAEPIGAASPADDHSPLAACLDDNEGGTVLLRRLAAMDPELDVLSRPQVMTLDGRPAQIQVGEAFPVITGATIEAGAVVPHVVQDHAGLALSLTPSLLSETLVHLGIALERSWFLKDAVPLFVDATTGETLANPIKNISTAAASYDVPDGRVLFLAVPLQRGEADADQAEEHASRSTSLLILQPRVIRGHAHEHGASPTPPVRGKEARE